MSRRKDTKIGYVGFEKGSCGVQRRESGLTIQDIIYHQRKLSGVILNLFPIVSPLWTPDWIPMDSADRCVSSQTLLMN